MTATILVLALLSTYACQHKDTNMKSTSRPFIICAHRGASGYAPENTLAAFRLAMEMGAQMIETDAQQTDDDRLVLLHDDDLDRTTTGTGFLWQKKLAELKTYDAGLWFDKKFAGERLPTLEEAMALVRGKVKLNIEVKLHGHERNVAQLVVDTIRREHFEKECIVTSFGQTVADEIKALAPELQVGYIFGKREYSDRVFSAPVDILSANSRLVDKEFMQKARAAGKQVHAWTVNDKDRMHELMALGVDAIITNYPDRLAQVVQERSQGAGDNRR